MKIKLFFIFAATALLSACGSSGSDFQGKNPKTVDVLIENDTVLITIPISTPYFHLVKVKDDSVPYEEFFFKYDDERDVYIYKTDLEDWQDIPVEETSFEAGVALIMIGEDDITIKHPSGTRAFP